MCPTDIGLGELWLGMIAAFGHRWASANGECAADLDEDGRRVLTRTGAIWQRGLAGIDDAMVRRGFEECITRADEWPPSLPAFRAMCLGVPSLAQVKADIRGTEQPHERAPFTRLVWQYLDHYRLSRSDSETAERLLREAYELGVDYIMRGGPMPEPSKALAPPPPVQRTPAKPETVAACTDEIHRWLRMGDYAEPEPASEPTAEAEASE